MSGLLQNPGFITWTKGPAALETLKNALCGLSRSVWKDFLNTLSCEEIEHLQEFIEDVGDVKADKKKKKWVFECDHKLCPILLEKLNAIRHNKKSMKTVWKTGCETVPLRRREDLFGLAEIFDHHRTICKTFYWHVANMFMLHGSERNEIPNTGPEDTDVAMVLKMMQNCTLFEIDEIKLFDEVINIRNRLFHGSRNVSEKDMTLLIGRMIELLNGVSEMPNCSEKHKNSIKYGIKELHELTERDFFTISAQPHWEYIALEALKVQKQAIQLDIDNNCTFSLDTEELTNILKTTDDRIQEISDSDEWRQRQNEEDERRREEEERIKEPLKKTISELEDLLEKEREETTSLRNKIRNLEKTNNDLQTRLSNTGHLAEGMSDTGAMSLLSGNIFWGHLWWHCSYCIRHSELMRHVSDLEELLKKKREVSASLKHQNRILEKSNNDLQTRLDGRELFPDTLARGLSAAIFGISILPCSNSERRHLELRKKVSDLEELLKKEREETTGHTNQNRILEERNIYLHARRSEIEETARLRNPIRMNNLKGIP